jgi:hypothetical protein
LTLVEFVVRRQLVAEEAVLAGLYAGNGKLETACPTAERLLEAFQEVTLTVVEGTHQVSGSFSFRKRLPIVSEMS